MTDNRDIDEILASLDALLREGDSHNDDMPTETTEQASDVMDINDLEAVLESDIASMESSIEELLDGDDVVESVSHEFSDDALNDRQEGSMSRVILTEDMMVENPQVRLPLAFSSEETHNVDMEDSREGGEEPALEEASVDDVVADYVEHSDIEKEDAEQHSVEQGYVEQNAASDEQPEGEPLIAHHVTHLHKQDVEQLMGLVSEDISEHLQQILPKLIKDSLHARLSDMQHESDENNKTSDDE